VVFAAAALEAGDPMAAKMGRLLNFYGDHLPSERREALGLVALFRTPTAESTLLPLWHEILGRTGEEPSLQGCLRGLHADHLLTADVGDDGVARYAAHPILRDYFRALLLGREGFAKSASAVLSLRPGSGQDRLPEADEIRFVVVELLLLQGEVRAAMDTLPETAELNFRRLAQVSRASLEAVERFGDRLEANAIYDMLVGFLALTEMSFRNLGEPVQNEEVQRRFVSRLEERLSVSDREVIALMRLAMSGASRLAAGDPTSITALSRATEHLDNSNPLRRIFSLVAWGLTGNLETTEAPTSATQAKTNFATIQLFVGGLSAFAIEALIKAKELAAARWAADQLYAALQSADRWTSNAAVAEYLTAWLALVERDYQGAHKSIDKAKPVFLRAPMVYDLAKLHLVEARLGLAEGNVEASFVAANAALRIAAPRRYRLIHADALNLRASSWLARAPANVVAARDDAEAALHLAETSNYRWAERDACERLALAYAQLGQAAEAARYQKRFDTLKKELVLPPGFSIIPETAPHERNAETSG
jgi:tetratricopeptide (TPR) repeat protein